MLIDFYKIANVYANQDSIKLVQDRQQLARDVGPDVKVVVLLEVI